MRYVLGETLQEYQEEIMEKDRPSVFLKTAVICKLEGIFGQDDRK